MECCGTEWPHGPIPVFSNKHQGRLPSLLKPCLKLEMRLTEKTNILEPLNILLLKEGTEQIAFADTVVLAQRLQAEKKKKRYYALILEWNTLGKSRFFPHPYTLKSVLVSYNPGLYTQIFIIKDLQASRPRTFELETAYPHNALGLLPPNNDRLKSPGGASWEGSLQGADEHLQTAPLGLKCVMQCWRESCCGKDGVFDFWNLRYIYRSLEISTIKITKLYKYFFFTS